MFNPYLMMAALFVAMAVVGAADASLASFSVVPWFNGLRWLRVHLITLGAMTETLFGLLPLLVAIRFGRPRPRIRWGTWLTLNVGLLALLIGIPIINQSLILLGGTLVFIATLLLIQRLWQMRPAEAPVAVAARSGHDGRPFYLVGLGYFLVGIIVGTGLWLGWSGPLRIQVPVEVHIHANNWGFLSLVFAGLLVDLYPTWAKRPLAWPRSVRPIFWMMSIGALFLVLGPWFKSHFFTVPGVVLHISATLWLLANVVRPLWGDRSAWARPGIWHLLTAYVWILAPVMVAPLIILQVPGFPGVGIEANAPQALIYGWVLQFGFALLPYTFRRMFLPGQAAALGGNWLSLAAVHLGGLFLWASIFVTSQSALLHGTAYALWALSIFPIALEIWRIVRDGMARLETIDAPAIVAPSPAGD